MRRLGTGYGAPKVRRVAKHSACAPHVGPAVTLAQCNCRWSCMQTSCMHGRFGLSSRADGCCRGNVMSFFKRNHTKVADFVFSLNMAGKLHEGCSEPLCLHAFRAFAPVRGGRPDQVVFL